METGGRRLTVIDDEKICGLPQVNTANTRQQEAGHRVLLAGSQRCASGIVQHTQSSLLRSEALGAHHPPSAQAIPVRTHAACHDSLTGRTSSPMTAIKDPSCCCTAMLPLGGSLPAHLLSSRSAALLLPDQLKVCIARFGLLPVTSVSNTNVLPSVLQYGCLRPFK